MPLVSFKKEYLENTNLVPPDRPQGLEQGKHIPPQFNASCFVRPFYRSSASLDVITHGVFVLEDLTWPINPARFAYEEMYPVLPQHVWDPSHYDDTIMRPHFVGGQGNVHRSKQ